jgi:hypothetical protein
MKGNAMFKKILLAAVFGACTVLGGPQARADDYVPPPKAPDQHSTATSYLSNHAGQPRSLTFSRSLSKQATKGGLSYETTIPRPTVKGYYEPKIVPYPAGKPVYVSGYYRRDGTYVQPHFRSLPSGNRQFVSSGSGSQERVSFRV